MRRKTTFRLWHVLLLAFILGVVACIPVYVRSPQQCILCRAEQTEYRIAAIPFATNFRDQHPFTQWFATHRPPHTHLWRYSGPGCLWERNFFGLPLMIYRMKRHPIIHVSPQEELLFVKDQDETALAKFFADVSSSNPAQRMNAVEAVRNRSQKSPP
jgi:hypothetical protein